MNQILQLKTDNLGKRFGKRWAVRNANLEVYKGDVFGFLGPNGAGKSTTIRMLLTLIKPTEGSIELFGEHLSLKSRNVLSRVAGLVERPDFYLYLTARRNLEIIAALQSNITKKEIERVLDIVGLLDRGDDKVKTFSHGMKQRLGIAQALLGNPELIILDEPTSGLDPQGIREVRELIKMLADDLGMTVFLSSHLLHEIEQTASRMAIVHKGELVVQGSVRELLNLGEHVMRIHALPVEPAILVAQGHPSVTEVARSGEEIEVTISPAEVGKLNAALVEAGIEVRSLVPKRSLEEFFLSITEGSSEVSRPEHSRKKDLSPDPDHHKESV